MPPSPKLESTIKYLVLQQALLRLTSNTTYPDILTYCLKRTEEVLNVRIHMLDHNIVQKNPYAEHNPNSQVIDIEGYTPLRTAYFHSNFEQFNQACVAKIKYLDQCGSVAQDHLVDPLSNDVIIAAIKKLALSGWLIYQEQEKLSINAMQTYRINFIKLQQDLQAIGYDLIIIKDDMI